MVGPRVPVKVWINNNEERLIKEYLTADTKLMWIDWCVTKYEEEVLV